MEIRFSVLFPELNSLVDRDSSTVAAGDREGCILGA